jgi:hypothetical protein
MLDRQANQGPLYAHGLCSTAATGMGFIALALASAPPYRLLSATSAVQRIRTGLETILQRLPHDEGVVPHFIDSRTDEVRGNDFVSTIETAWLAAGGLWAAAFLRDVQLETLARRLYDRVDWHYWTVPDEAGARGLLRHGKDRRGHFLPWSWDRVNGETAFMYILAAGAAEGRAVAEHSWTTLQPFYGIVAGQRFNNADLGLFVFQYGLDLLDLRSWQAPSELDLMTEAQLATLANHQLCRDLAEKFATFQRFWGLSAGDGPGEASEAYCYRCYAPGGPIDGTAHITATLASVAHLPIAVLENLHEAQRDSGLSLHGRFGFSNVNVDRAWVSRDIIGIDLGAAVLGLDNYLMADRVRGVFQSIPCVRRGLERLGFKYRNSPPPAESPFSQPLPVRQAS